MNRSRLLALLALIGMVAGSVLAHAQHANETYVQVVHQATSQISLTTAKNPSNINDGTPAILTVSGPGTSVPTGLVTFSAVSSGSIATGQVAATAAITLDSTGKASWVFNLAPGKYDIIAVYSGDADYTGGQARLTQIVLGPADFSLVSDSASLIVKQGSTWTGSLKATSINNFSGTITMSCDGGGAAVYMTCLPGQPFALTAVVPVECAVQVTTTATTLKIVGGLGMLLLGAGLGSRKRQRRQRMYSYAVLSLLLLFAGCGGVRYEQRDGTPRGNYKMTFVGQSGSLSHAVTLVVTVQ